jgi:hypothetical protein
MRRFRRIPQLERCRHVIDFEHNGRNYALHYLRSGYHDQEYTIAALALKDTAIHRQSAATQICLRAFLFTVGLFAR